MANKAAPQKGGLAPNKSNPQRLSGQKPSASVKPTSRAAAAQPKPENRLVRFYRELKTELKKVVWPSRETAIKLTVLVIVVCAVVGMALGLVDLIFSELLKLLLGAA